MSEKVSKERELFGDLVHSLACLVLTLVKHYVKKHGRNVHIEVWTEATDSEGQPVKLSSHVEINSESTFADLNLPPDGTCTNDSRKCCGNCGDEPRI